MKEYRICTKCIMDTTDPLIDFDSNGVCNHCNNFEKNIKPLWHPDNEGALYIKEIVQKMKKKSKKNKYDCILGLSGGVDSSYLAYIGSNLGLRILAVHVDAGWNSETAVNNIEKICKKLNIDLHTIVVDWDEMKELQRAYLFSGLANQDVPQDHVFFSALYSYAVKNKIKYVLHGSNFATESILPKSWGYDAMDLKQIKSISKMYSRSRLKKLPLTGYFKRDIYFKIIKGMKVVKLLNYLPYSKTDAINTLRKEFDWQYYGGKHYESRFTKFFQGYYLPTKFGYDKKRAHLSSLIVTGELSREEALLELQKKDYSDDQIKKDRDYLLKKLDLSIEDYNHIMSLPNKTHLDYPSGIKTKNNIIKLIKMVKKLLGKK